MAYVSPSNKTTGDLITAADWNQDIVANSQAGVPDIFTTAGDLAYATGADAATRLGIGASATVLRSTGSAPAWSNIAVPQIVRWTAQQDFTTNTTLANVTAGVQAIGASEVWMVQYLLALGGAGTGGFKWAVTIPASATMSFSAVWYAGATPSSGQTTTSGTAIAGVNAGSTPTLAQMVAVVVNSTNAGNIQLQAAQNSSSGTNSILVNSVQIAHRIA